MGSGWGRRRGGVEQPILLSSFSVPSSCLSFPVSRVKRDLLEVGISGHGADRCDQDDEIYLMVQEIWSESMISGMKLVLFYPGHRGLLDAPTRLKSKLRPSTGSARPKVLRDQDSEKTGHDTHNNASDIDDIWDSNDGVFKKWQIRVGIR